MRQRTYIFVLMLATTLLVRAEETNGVPATNVSQAATNVVQATTNAVAQASAPETDVVSFDEFKIITQRNIFDPNRSAPGQRRRDQDRPKPTRIDYMNLVGAMSYENGRIAFFDGSSSEYRKSVKPGDSIAGYKVATVTASKVTLESGEKKVELPVGGQLKRVDEGEWQVNQSPESFASAGGSSTASSSTASSTSTGSGSQSGGSADEPSEALKRLLERRRNEK
jgi:hypothetical protein